MAFGIDDIIGAGLQIINKFIPDPAAQAEAAAQFRAQVLAAATASDVAQGQTNSAEAANASVFVSGWRPMIGWVCSISLAYQYLGKPCLSWLFAARGLTLPPLPGLDDTLWQLLFGMLGLGTLRSIEKIKGATK